MRLGRKDRLLVAAYLLGSLPVFLIAKWLGPSVLPIASLLYLVLGICLVLAVVLSSYRKAVGIAEADREIRYWQSRQSQAMFSLLSLLPLRRPLPPFAEWSITPDFANILTGLVLEHRPGLVLELGSGASSLINSYLLEAAGRGRLIALDHEEEYFERTRRMLARHGLSEVSEVRWAPLKPMEHRNELFQWYDPERWQDLQQIDLVVVDGPPRSTNPMARYPALPALATRLSPQAVIVLDDYKRDDERAAVRRWLEDDPAWELEEVDCEKGACILRRAEQPASS